MSTVSQLRNRYDRRTPVMLRYMQLASMPWLIHVKLHGVSQERVMYRSPHVKPMRDQIKNAATCLSMLKLLPLGTVKINHMLARGVVTSGRVLHFQLRQKFKNIQQAGFSDGYPL